MFKRRRALKQKDGEINLSGLYNGSIIKAFFIKKIHHFKDLDHRLFVK
jgi:hypothetical protein